jgi:hypothetical protein
VLERVSLGDREVDALRPERSLGIEGALAPDDTALVVTPSPTYPAVLCARDIVAVSHLRTLRDVLVEGERSAAECIAALLTGEFVSLATSAGTVRHVANRPAPPTPVTVWWREGEHWSVVTPPAS